MGPEWRNHCWVKAEGVASDDASHVCQGRYLMYFMVIIINMADCVWPSYYGTLCHIWEHTLVMMLRMFNIRRWRKTSATNRIQRISTILPSTRPGKEVPLHDNDEDDDTTKYRRAKGYHRCWWKLCSRKGKKLNVHRASINTEQDEFEFSGPTYIWTFSLKTKSKSSKWVLAGVGLLLQIWGLRLARNMKNISVPYIMYTGRHRKTFFQNFA